MYRMFGSSGPSEMTSSQNIPQLILLRVGHVPETLGILGTMERKGRSGLFLHPYDSPSLPKLITYEDFLKLLKKKR